jgi:2-phospho-L-lactate transferase/gluconeogenesis factor (CofD/UPF0052 family)
VAGILPPGDLRMALAALAGDGPRTQEIAALLQHRFGGSGVLAGHPVGNLVLTGLTEMYAGDAVRALDVLAGLLVHLCPAAPPGSAAAGGPGGDDGDGGGGAEPGTATG